MAFGYSGAVRNMPPPPCCSINNADIPPLGVTRWSDTGHPLTSCLFVLPSLTFVLLYPPSLTTTTLAMPYPFQKSSQSPKAIFNSAKSNGKLSHSTLQLTTCGPKLSQARTVLALRTRCAFVTIRIEANNNVIPPSPVCWPPLLSLLLSSSPPPPW